jgi:hypothetical protein
MIQKQLTISNWSATMPDLFDQQPQQPKQEPSLAFVKFTIDSITELNDTIDDINKRLTILEATYKEMAQLNDLLVNNQIQRLLAHPSIREVIFREVQQYVKRELARHKTK